MALKLFCVCNASIQILLILTIISYNGIHASQTPMIGQILSNNYTRIRIKTTEDIVKGYSLLLDYLDKPSLASSVREIAFDKPHQGTGGGCYLTLPPGDDEAPKPNDILNDEQYSREENRIIGALNRLGLSKGLDIHGGKEQAHVEAVNAIKKWRKSHVAQIGTMEGQPSSWQKHWSQDKAVNGAFAQVLAPLLISLSPNIEKLKLTQLDQVTLDFFLQVNSGLLPPTCLQNVKHVTFGPSQNGAFWQYDERFFNSYALLSMVRLVHKLPSLESIIVEGISEDENDLTIQPPGSSTLKRLHIGHSDISSSSLSYLIRMAKALEDVSISVGGRSSNDGGYSVMNPKTIAKSLLVHRGSLKTLDLDLDAYIHGPHRYDQDGPEEGEDHVGDSSDHEYLSETLEYHRKDKFFRIDEAESRRLGLPLLAKDLPDTRKYGNTIGSLHDFTAMTKLSIGVKLLLGPQVYTYNTTTSTGSVVTPLAPFRLISALPPNLRYFCIRGYVAGQDEAWDDQINEFLENKAVKLPDLKEVVGIDKEIPGLEVIEDPDQNMKLMWRDPRAEEDLWEEWGEIPDFWADYDDGEEEGED